ncbi:MAG: AAA family ATPase, partial [Elusimicrobia bacterium]|nr:AAA family ATPase [Elusimicrobiota bacterium]
MTLLTPRPRYLHKAVAVDLSEKMVFIGGPRQVGKTTFALGLLRDKAGESHPAYLTWDDPNDRERLLKAELPSGQSLVILDEVHKYALWRNLVKGLYDKHKTRTSFLVTGSARLDYYRKGGDSLQGRYHYYRMHPFSLREIDAECRASSLEHLLAYGGFPEPFLRANERVLRRWQREHRERVAREDLRDLEHVREISLIELLLTHLPRCVG